MATTAKKYLAALLCLSLLISSFAVIITEYRYDSGGVHFAAVFRQNCYIREYKKQSLEQRTGCDDARICAADNAAAPNRDTDSALPGEAYKTAADMSFNLYNLYAHRIFVSTQRKSFYPRI